VSGVLVAAPTRLEEAVIRSAAPRALVRHTGMGPARSRSAASSLAREAGAALLVLGVCGGLDEASRPGEVIVAERVLAAHDEHDAPAPVACPGAGELAAALAATGLQVRAGPIVCVSKIAVGERRAQLHARGALAVDMESVWLAGGAAGRPFAVVRVVLDSPSHELLRPGAVLAVARAARALRRTTTAALQCWRPERLR
jgi:4-hydroxy-3-methylbut-2-en-1-yl diphosphate reductase